MLKTLKFLVVFLLFVGILFFLGIVVGKETPLVGRKTILFIGIYLVIFYEGIKWTITKIDLTENKVTELMFLLMTILWGLSAALFFMLAVTMAPTALPLRPETYVQWVATHTFYISVWIMILYKIQASMADIMTTTKTIYILAIVLVALTIGLTVYFEFSAGINVYLPPRYPARYNFNPLFILIEVLCLIIAIIIFIGTIIKSADVFLPAIPLLFFILFYVFTDMGRFVFDRMRYDFIFFGPILLSLGLSFEIIMRRVVMHFIKRMA